MAPERLEDSAREGFGRTAIAYVVLLVALVLTVLAFYYVGRNVEAREHERFEEITGSAERAVDRRMQTYTRRDARRKGPLRRERVGHARGVGRLRSGQRP